MNLGYFIGVSRAVALAAVTAFAVALVPPAEARDAPQSFADMVDKLLPTVVNITTTQNVPQQGPRLRDMPQLPPGSPFEELFKEFFDRRGGDQQRELVPAVAVPEAAAPVRRRDGDDHDGDERTRSDGREEPNGEQQATAHLARDEREHLDGDSAEAHAGEPAADPCHPRPAEPAERLLCTVPCHACPEDTPEQKDSVRHLATS